MLFSSQLGYLITPVGSGNLTITAAPLTITGATASDKVYDGTTKPVTASGYSLGGADAGNYTLSAQPTGLTANITPYPLIVTADAKSIKKGDANAALTYTATDLFGNDTFTGALTRETGDVVGSYNVLQGSLSAGSNYSITFEGAEYTILAKPVSIDPVVPIIAFTGRTNARIFNLQGVQVWSGMLDVSDGHFIMPNVGTGKWVVKMRMGNSAKVVNQVVR